MIENESKFQGDYDEDGLPHVAGQLQDWDRGGVDLYPTGFGKPWKTLDEIFEDYAEARRASVEHPNS